MSERIITLFGEEMIPEQAKPVTKVRVKNKPEEKQEQIEFPIEDPIAVTAPEENLSGVTRSEETKENAIETASVPAPVEKGKKRELENEIILPEDWTGEKQYYTIGEVAELFKVKTSHIRFWTNEFKLKVRTTRKGDRLFTAEQIRELRAIHHLVKERGFTLTGAKAKLKSQNKMDVETIDLKQSLLQLRNKLLIIRNQLR